MIEGYAHDQLVETVFQKTMACQPQGDWPLMAGVSRVLDFGGGCGQHYKLAVQQSDLDDWTERSEWSTLFVVNPGHPH